MASSSPDSDISHKTYSSIPPSWAESGWAAASSGQPPCCLVRPRGSPHAPPHLLPIANCRHGEFISLLKSDFGPFLIFCHLNRSQWGYFPAGAGRTCPAPSQARIISPTSGTRLLSQHMPSPRPSFCLCSSPEGPGRALGTQGNKAPCAGPADGSGCGGASQSRSPFLAAPAFPPPWVGLGVTWGGTTFKKSKGALQNYSRTQMELQTSHQAPLMYM